MIIPIAAADVARYWQDFYIALRNIFPMLSYTPAQTDAFWNHWQAQSEHSVLFRVETSAGQVFAGRTDWNIQYLIPVDWNNRYGILQEALEEIKSNFLCSGAEKLSIPVNDGFPTHSLYYAGMLPMLGYEVHSGEITLQAPENLLDSLTLPVLPPGVREVSGEHDRITEYAALYAAAHSAREGQLLTEEECQKWRASVGDAALNEDMWKTWIGLEFQGEIVASCYGGCRPERWGEFLSVEELAAAPKFFGRGLGRYVLIRCLQELKRHYGVPGRPFQIGTWRHMGPRPLRLYLGLGFQVMKAEVYASFWNRSRVDV